MEKQRLLKIQDGYNFRDLGGYQTTDGHTVKWRKLLRTGSLANINSADQQLLEQIPVTVDIDLRSPAEVKQDPDKPLKTASYHHLPVFDTDETDASHSDEEITKRMQEAGNGYRHMSSVYQRMTTIGSARAAFRTLFTLLLENKGEGAVLFHCTAGKDRTGMAAFLILSALGVPEETIMQDYLLTNTATKQFREEWLKQLRERYQGLPNQEILLENRNALSSVNADYLLSAINSIKEQTGDVNHYLTDYLNLSNSDLLTLRNLYLD